MGMKTLSVFVVYVRRYVCACEEAMGATGTTTEYGSATWVSEVLTC